MIKEALQYLVSLAAPPAPLEIGNLTYTERALKLITPPMPGELTFRTLTGFADYILGQRDQLQSTKLMIHVESPISVKLLSPLDEDFQLRACYAHAIDDRSRFAFNQPMAAEQFLIKVMAEFANLGDRSRLLTLIGSMKNERVDHSADDGVTQTVTRRIGASLGERATIENPFILAPNRTFPELIQPQSSYILRVHQSADGELPRPALYEADNDAWRLAAMGLIKEWLAERVKDIPILA